MVSGDIATHVVLLTLSFVEGEEVEEPRSDEERDEEVDVDLVSDDPEEGVESSAPGLPAPCDLMIVGVCEKTNPKESLSFEDTWETSESVDEEKRVFCETVVAVCCPDENARGLLGGEQKKRSDSMAGMLASPSLWSVTLRRTIPAPAVYAIWFWNELNPADEVTVVPMTRLTVRYGVLLLCSAMFERRRRPVVPTGELDRVESDELTVLLEEPFVGLVLMEIVFIIALGPGGTAGSCAVAVDAPRSTCASEGTGDCPIERASPGPSIVCKMVVIIGKIGKRKEKKEGKVGCTPPVRSRALVSSRSVWRSFRKNKRHLKPGRSNKISWETPSNSHALQGALQLHGRISLAKRAGLL